MDLNKIITKRELWVKIYGIILKPFENQPTILDQNQVISNFHKKYGSNKYCRT